LEGSGIGLAFVEELVRIHGGSVRVESAPGRGSTFTVTIPFGTAHLPSERVRRGRERDSLELGVEAYVEEARRWNSTTDAPQVPASPAVEHVPSTPTVTADERDVKPARPLIVLADDCADMREYMRRLLAPHYAVEAVPDGQAALEFARTTRPDLVLTDVMMPRLDGFGLLRELRSDPRLRTVPVILVTAVAGDDSCVQALDAGADDYLVKPFGNRELLARVRATMELDRLRTDVERAAGREEALRAESRRKDDFLAVLSHELRTPLTPLQLQLHLIEESLGQQSTLEAPAARTRLLQLLASSARQLDGLSLLVEDVLEFLSITEGPVTIHREAFDLSDLTRTVLRRDSSKTTSPIELHAETVVRGQWDRHRIEQVVTKLLANATKYGQGKPISVSVSESDADGRHHAILSVEDHGVGIAEKDQSRIFETFERAVSTRHFGGLGLGLYVSRRIVEAHGGSLHVESQPGEGATFTLELPMPA
ncbi:MAG TPA: ATP-binding protein, partial [Labilithrix sp.]|nr:ATP-binding protein [Labilithrix sp.]